MRTSRNSFFFLVFLLIGRCSADKESKIQFTVESRLNDKGDTLSLQLSFRSNNQQTLLLDLNALSIYDPNFESEELLSDDLEIEKIIDSISHTQFVIENSANTKRFFSDIKLFEGETMEVKNIFSFDSQIDTLRLSKDQVTAKAITINVNRLKIEPSDTVIRLHYLFKPTAEQKQAGFKAFVVSSNWFKLSP